MPGHDRRTDRLADPAAPCVGANCAGFDQWKETQPAAPAAPVRECPADSSMVTVRPGVRYCIPDRPLRD